MTVREAGGRARRTRSPRGEGEKLREEILAAAEGILVETGDEACLSIRAIASAVGVTPPSIYLHFADRNDLVFAVCERQALQLESAMEEAAEGAADGWSRIRRRGRAYLRWGLDNPAHYRILMMSRADATPDRFVDDRLAATAGLGAVEADLAAASAEGLVRPIEDPLREAELLWMVVHGVVSLFISKPGFAFGEAEQVYDAMLELVYSGLEARR